MMCYAFVNLLNAVYLALFLLFVFEPQFIFICDIWYQVDEATFEPD
ncbi:unnamed protein product [Gongylonema pulchrum]|uniref:Uncharacterized protein n=1 Tax=Gongylonema pulchrum TaxID=637853 RepID=A0A3P6SKE7_9BILA|nr:unnamed protein product [Gongylonema pulchrum]